MKPMYPAFTKQLLSLLLLTISAPAAIMCQVVTSSNVALNKGASASSYESNFTAAKAFDGDNNTRFSSAYSDNEWIAIDLGKPFLINQVVLVWSQDYAKDFNLLFSKDGSFRDLMTDSLQIRNNVLTGTTIAGTNTITMKSNTSARYVRMQGVHRATANGYSLFEFQVSGTTYLSAALPVTITGFAAAVTQTSTNQLEWSTTTEYNTAGFTIEKSSDANNFYSIGWIAGQNGGTVTAHYSFTDKQVTGSRNFYRLKITDLNGASAYSPVIAATAPGAAGIKSYPVPVSDHITVDYTGTTGESVRIALLNSAGQPIYSNTVVIKAMQQKMIINRTAGMKPGTYFLSVVTTANGQYTKQIVLQ